MERIIKEKGSDGEAIYKFPNGKKIDIYQDTLEDIFSCGLERVEMVFDLLHLDGDIDLDSFYHIGNAVIRDVRNQLERVNDFIEENFGAIEIEAATYHQIGIEGGKMLGVVFKANNQGK